LTVAQPGRYSLGVITIKKSVAPFHWTMLAFFGLAATSLATSAVEKKSERPNILFIMTDDHAAHAISAYGSKINRTPQLDRLAKEGMRLNNCFVVNSICTPSRAAILTGKYSHINGVTVFNRFDGSQWTVAKTLQAAGYHTGMIGKWHLTSDPTGFDVWDILPGQGLYHDPLFITAAGQRKHSGYATDIITDKSIEFLKNRPKDKPFFLMSHHKAPHRAWEPDAKHAKMYEDIEIPEPDTFHDDYATRSAAVAEATMRIDRDLNRNDLKMTPPSGLTGPELAAWKRGVDTEVEVTVNGQIKKLTGLELKKWKYQRYIKDYLRCVASVDDNVGRLLEFLDTNALRENTVVIYTSDQGFFLGDHNWYDKRFMYEECLRMPFLVRYPGHIKPGRTSDAMALNVDFAPTFLEYAGLPVPPEIQGRSLVPVLSGKTPRDWRKEMYYRYYHDPGDHNVRQHYGIRTERYKLIYFNRIDQWELFDLKKDPRELKNIYSDPKQAGNVKKLKADLTRLRTELNDRDQLQDLGTRFQR
jgi:arylsulfatase A-like enzyme